MQDQRSTWEKIEDDEPDWLFMWGWGAMNPTAVKGAADDRLPDGSLHRRVVVRQRVGRP